tara:strand:- start:54 stop:380 length:327 start_codon:yes stop_codon:yes gene_type:complete
MTKYDIKAKVMWSWNHPNSKFLPDLHAIVNEEVSNNTYNSKRRKSFEGRRGKVIAVSSPDGKRIRGDQTRMYTNYYLEFANGEVCGFDACHLDLPTDADGNYEFGVID